MKGYGVVLGGGGAKGAYEIGVWRALRELNIPICAVAGTSVGALNGAMIVQGDYELAQKMWTGMTMGNVINLEREINETEGYLDKRALLLNTMKTMVVSGGLDVSPLKQMLQDVIDEKKIRKSEIDLGMVTFSVTDLKPLNIFKKDIPEGRLIEYLLASACFPAFKLQQIDNKRFIDGGVYDNIPISLLKEKNIRNIIAVDVSGIGLKRRVDTSGLDIINIKNSENLGGTLDFNGERSIRNIDIGYYDTLKAFDRLNGKNYYLMPHSDYEVYRKKYLDNIDIDDFRRLYDFLGIDWGRKLPSADRLILYKIMKTIRMYAGNKLSLETIIPAMAEITAEQMGINRVEVYTLSQLIEAIESQYENIKGEKRFNDYMESIRKLVVLKSQIDFNREVKSLLIEGKFLIYYAPNINDNDKMVKRFRKFMALAFTKICIANLFVSMVLSKREQ